MKETAETTKMTIDRADSRGFADSGWLKTYHTFGYGDYFNPDRVRFGALRVLDDDKMEGGQGFGRHPDENLEIVTLPLEGELLHRDSLGNVSVIGVGMVQVMTAGTGILHSEYNASGQRPVRFLQIGIVPREEGLRPRYEVIRLEAAATNTLQLIVGPKGSERVGRINQDAWLFEGVMEKGAQTEYRLRKSGDGVYLFVVSGEIAVEGETLRTRDGMGIREVDSFTIRAATRAHVLSIEVPMQIGSIL